MVYGLPEGEILDSQFDIAFASGSGHPDSDLQRNDLGVIPNIVPLKHRYNCVDLIIYSTRFTKL